MNELSDIYLLEKKILPKFIFLGLHISLVKLGALKRIREHGQFLMLNAPSVCLK